MDGNAMLLDALRLQNGYAFAVDTRDWAYFRTLFAPAVVATYDGTVYEGMDRWLDFFVPFHEQCQWTRHQMSNHLVGRDDDGTWAVCYGVVEWTMIAAPRAVHTAKVVYRDRLEPGPDGVVIAARQLDLIASAPDQPIPDGTRLTQSILELIAHC